jgi:hypothetical protein
MKLSFECEINNILKYIYFKQVFNQIYKILFLILCIKNIYL